MAQKTARRKSAQKQTSGLSRGLTKKLMEALQSEVERIAKEKTEQGSDEVEVVARPILIAFCEALKNESGEAYVPLPKSPFYHHPLPEVSDAE